MMLPMLTMEVRAEADIILTRQRARQIAALVGFSPLDQTRVATAVSEIARNAHQHAGGGRVEFALNAAPPQCLVIQIRQRGAGFEDLQAMLDGRSPDPAPTGLGVAGARRLMDRFAVESTGGGTAIVMSKTLPARPAPLDARDVAKVTADLARRPPQGLLEEIQVQNQELSRALQELKDRQAELAHIHDRELEETNRGVVALYSELDDHAKALRRISDLKTRFLSNMSHEFRSPLNTILSMSGFLLDDDGGGLSEEQKKEIGFIRKAAEDLSGLVNDLLDLAKVEAGKAVVRPATFEVADLFEHLNGTTRPLLVRSRVALSVELAPGLAPMHTDEGKLGQILRNLLSNAVKFTEAGVVRLSASPGPGDAVTFAVSDTGIGIRPEDEARIFEEFTQVEGPIQSRVRGTGLGLPLSRKLADLLGGRLSVSSEPGRGSTFTVEVPRVFAAPAGGEAPPPASARAEPRSAPVLVVEDDPEISRLYEGFLHGSGFRVIPAATLNEARAILASVRPAAILLDIILDAESGWTLLTELKARPETRGVPIFVLTVVDGRDRAIQLGADEFCLKPIDRDWLLGRLRALGRARPVETILIVDDQEADRRVLKSLLAAHGSFDIVEAIDGASGLARAIEARPNLVILDLVLPDLTGIQVMERLKARAETRDIPIIINTSSVLDERERRLLEEGTAAILIKSADVTSESLAAILAAIVRVGLIPVPNVPEA